MILYSLLLFVHITAMLALFACLSFEVFSLIRLRRASALVEVRLWMELVPSLTFLTASSALVVFLSGMYLARRISGFAMAWIEVSIAALLLIAPLGALTVRHNRAIRHACADAKAFDSRLRSRLQDPFLQISLGIRIAIFLGIVLLMTAKPELWTSISIVGGSVLFGFLSSLMFSRRGGTLKASGADVGAR